MAIPIRIPTAAPSISFTELTAANKVPNAVPIIGVATTPKTTAATENTASTGCSTTQLKHYQLPHQWY